MVSLLKYKVLVTGGRGFVGSHVVNELLKRGHQVHILDSDTHIPCDLKVKSTCAVDLRDRESLIYTMRHISPDAIVHLAAIHYIPYCNLHPGETYSVNVGGTQNLIEAALKVGGVRKFFAASSAGVYAPSSLPHSECAPTWPVDIYGFTKKAMEYDLLEMAERSDIQVRIGRYFNMYGYGETTPHVIPVIISQIKDGITPMRLGNIDTRRDFVHVCDNANATCDLLEMDNMRSVIVNLGSGISYSARDLIDILASITGKPYSVETDPNLARVSDRPNLVANLTRFHILGLTPPSIDIRTGLSDLLNTGIGPFLRRDVC